MYTLSHRWLLCLSLGTLLTLQACDKDKTPEPTLPYGKGLFIVNEGNFGAGDGNISHYDPDKNELRVDIFNTENSRPLGDIVQSLSFYADRAYIVVNNSNKVEVAQAGTFKSTGVINGLPLPRYFLGINATTGYVSQWGSSGLDGAVSVVDLNTLTVRKTIATGAGADQLVAVAPDRVWVLNAGGFGTDNRISVINTGSDTKIADITVADNPNSIAKAADGSYWVLCGGNKVYTPTWEIDTTASTAGRLVSVSADGSIRPATYTWFNDKAATPKSLVADATGNNFYFLVGDKIARLISGYPPDILVSGLTGAYSLSYSPNGQHLCVGFNDGTVRRYNTNGTLVNTIPTSGRFSNSVITR